MYRLKWINLLLTTFDSPATADSTANVTSNSVKAQPIVAEKSTLRASQTSEEAGRQPEPTVLCNCYLKQVLSSERNAFSCDEQNCVVAADADADKALQQYIQACGSVECFR